MEKIKTSFIYAITDLNETKFYYGHTKKLLHVRLCEHLSDYKRFKSKKSNKFVSSSYLFDEFGVNNCKINLISYVYYYDKKDIYDREKYYIKNKNCVNIKCKKKAHLDF